MQWRQDSKFYPEFYTCLSDMIVAFLFVKKMSEANLRTEAVILLCRPQR